MPSVTGDDPADWLSGESLADDQLSAMILGYLKDRPQASDTLEGIARWWLPRQQLRVDLERLARVLHRLTERDILEKAGTGEYTRYQLKSFRDGR